MWKTTFREVKQSFGRYVAILAIIALGVGFFSGLKITKTAMVQTADDYWKENQLFDYRLISTLGFEKEDVEAFAGEENVRAAEGAISADILYLNADGNESVMKVHSMPSEINGITLTEGRMPQSGNECVVDSELYTADQLGDKIVLSANNEAEDRDLFAYGEYTIVGIAQSSYYANFERGNTSLGSGRLSGFMYIPAEGFDCDYYTEVFIKFDEDLPIYSDEYDAYIDQREDEWDAICARQVESRYKSIVEDAEAEIADARAELDEQKADAEEKLSEAEAELIDAQEQLDDGKQEIEKAKKELDESRKELDEQETLLNQQAAELESRLEMLPTGESAAMVPQAAAMMAELTQAQEQITAARAQIEAGRKQIKDAEAEIEEKQAELADAEEEISDGWQEYNDSKSEFEEETREAEEKLTDAQAELDDLEEPDYYVLGRNTNTGYVCFESDSSIVDGIANVVPVFFFLVAALVCMTTMNRMVEEQRTQIGVLKALGYGDGVIMSKYMFYSGSAAIVGCIAGFFGGTWLFPLVIWQAYNIMYSLADIHYMFDGTLAGISIVIALICSMGATWFTCKNELSASAANLMRPKSPKAGKRVFLERIPFIWKKLKFLHKVSVRNIFRYKKRFFMMVAGISGCTALLVTGFGIRDSVTDVADQQFEEIQIYDMSVTFKEAQDKDKESSFTQAAAGVADTYAYFCEKSVDLEYDGDVKSVNLVVPEVSAIGEYLQFRTTSGEEVSYPGEGQAIISHKLSENYGISVGDSIVLRDSDLCEIEATVSGIFENYVYNYVYIDSQTYALFTGEKPEYKTAYVNLKEGQDAHEASAAFMKLDQISSVTVNADIKERFSSMMSSLDYVVMLIILCAAFLAFIVLYNLTNINITERVREIATLKVLGFFRMETASYVFRENIILTAIGTAVGLLLGRFLHLFVMKQINIDMITFDVHIKPVSYLFSILLTALFACIVNLFMSAKLETINMAESLKSVD